MNPRIPWSFRYRARLIRVIDGDTLLVQLAIGCDVYRTLTVRLRGVDAAPARSPEGIAATAYVQGWFAAHADVDGVVIVQTFKDAQERYGRYLADVTGADGSSLVADLVAANQGMPWDGRGAHPTPNPQPGGTP